MRGAAKRSGFTVLELLLIVVMLGIFAAMVVPLAASIGEARKVGETEAALQGLRADLVGPADRYDASGRPVYGGYVADLSTLPRLYYGAWNQAQKSWAYTDDAGGPAANPAPAVFTEQVQTQYAGSPSAFYATWDQFTLRANYPGDDAAAEEELRNFLVRLQPIGLWEARILDADETPLWQGPYRARPVDRFPGDADPDGWRSGEDARVRAFLARANAGRLADAWGRALVFFPYYDAAEDRAELWVVSRGPDGRVSWNLSGAYIAYDEDAQPNADNLVVKIRYSQWRETVVQGLEDKTRAMLEEIREALVGAREATDEKNRPVVGGFVGDMGRLAHFYRQAGDGFWPYRFRWDAQAGVWEPEQWTGAAWAAWGGTFDAQDCVPRGLWTRDPAGDPDAALPALARGVGWRTTYLRPPADEDERPVDAWGRPVRFYHDDEGVLWILSAGPDGKMALPAAGNAPGAYDADAAQNADNVAVTLRDAAWHVAANDEPIGFAVTGSVTGDTRARLVLRPDERQADPDEIFRDLRAPGRADAWAGWFPAYWHTLEDWASGTIDAARWSELDSDAAPPSPLSGNVRVENERLTLNGSADWAENGLLTQPGVTVERAAGDRVRLVLQAHPSAGHELQAGLYTDPALLGAGAPAGSRFVVRFEADGDLSLGDGASSVPAPAPHATWSPGATYTVTITFGCSADPQAGFTVHVNGAQVFDSDSALAMPGTDTFHVGVQARVDHATERWALLQALTYHAGAPLAGAASAPAGARQVLLWEDRDADETLDPDEALAAGTVVIDAQGRPDRTVAVTIP